MTEPNPHLLDYVKPPYPIIKKKPIQDDEARIFSKFKEMIATIWVSISFHEILELISTPPLSDYVNPPYPIIKKKLIQDDEAGIFVKFKEMLATLQVNISSHEILELMPKFAKFMKALLKVTKDKMVKEHVNMTDKDDVVVPQALPPKLKDPGKFNISYR